MSKRVHWYLEGWSRRKERTPSGKEKTVWVYTGAYFSFLLDSRALRRLKAAYGVCIGLESVLWFLLALGRTAGKDGAFYVGGPWYMSLVPLLFLLIGGLSFMRVSQRMTYRDMYGSYKVMVYSNVALLIMHGIAAVGMIVFLAAGRQAYQPGRELGWLLGVLICTGLDGAIMYLHRRYPPLAIPAEPGGEL